MLLDDLNQLAPVPERAVIINVGTEIVSALAIASALSNADMPLLVGNCTPPGPARTFMQLLAQEWGFDLVDLQLAEHGTTIDRLMDAFMQTAFCLSIPMQK